jgi:hypothetical protein
MAPADALYPGGTMTQHIRFALSLIAACGTAAVLSAQTPSQPQTPPRPQTPTTQPSTRDAQATPITVNGCLKMEKDVAGLKPNVAEKAGMGDDFILTNVKPGSGKPSAGASGSGTSSSGTSATGTSGTGTSGTSGTGTSGTAATGSGSSATSQGRPVAGLMYKITGLDDDELKKHVNHQVEVTGRVEESGSGSSSGSPSASAGSSDISQPKEFRATSLKMVASTCSAGTN